MHVHHCILPKLFKIYIHFNSLCIQTRIGIGCFLWFQLSITYISKQWHWYLLTMILSIFWMVKNVTKMSLVKGHKPTMNDFGSNNLVPHVHALYLNLGTKWMKNQAWRPNLTCWSTSKYGQLTIQVHLHDWQSF